MNYRLKLAVIVSGRPQRDVAREAGVSEQRLSDIVREYRTPNDDERRAIERVLGRGPEVWQPMPVGGDE